MKKKTHSILSDNNTNTTVLRRFKKKKKSSKMLKKMNYTQKINISNTFINNEKNKYTSSTKLQYRKVYGVFFFPKA